MPKFFMLGIVLSLLLGAAGYGLTTIQARSIPWDCADWQAFAHADRTTSILESLAENRGKALYCGVDQSDTFTKAETWAAGKDRNERDDTVYYGERGQFRGFIAAQEGYLTDGESGVTGVSIDRSFEFPREERRRTKRVKRLDIANDAVQFPIDNSASCGQILGLICGPWGGASTVHNGRGGAVNNARRNLIANTREVNWQTQEISTYTLSPRVVTPTGNYQAPTTDQWTAMATAAAKRACRAEGYPQVTNVAFGPGHNGNNGDITTVEYKGEGLGMVLSEDQDPNNNPNHFKFQMRQSRTWSATCKKVIRRTRK